MAGVDNMKIFNHIIELNFRAKLPITHFKVHKRDYYTHIVWGKMSLIYGQPHLEPIHVHKGCNGLVNGLGEDSISYCEDCETIVEGDTEYITLEEFEKNC